MEKLAHMCSVGLNSTQPRKKGAANEFSTLFPSQTKAEQSGGLKNETIQTNINFNKNWIIITVSFKFKRN